MTLLWNYGDVVAFFLCLNPPKPSLTVREGPRGPAALGTPANWTNVGDQEALLLAVPFGNTLWLRAMERFSPCGYVLLLVLPGNLIKQAGFISAFRAPEGLLW
ncbi:hypothetical protein D3C73_833900 [compost metagenome]